MAKEETSILPGEISAEEELEYWEKFFESIQVQLFVWAEPSQLWGFDLFDELSAESMDEYKDLWEETIC